MYWYELTSRGISLGCQPDGFIDKDFNYGKYGAVAYDTLLSKKAIISYELNYIGYKD